MKIFYYKGLGGKPSKCGISIIDWDDGFKIVVLTELPQNTGTAITDFFVNIATLVFRQLLSNVPADKIKWVEHYFGGPVMPAIFDSVNLKWDGFAGGAYSESGIRTHLRHEEIKKIKAQMLV